MKVYQPSKIWKCKEYPLSEIGKYTGKLGDSPNLDSEYTGKSMCKCRY